MFRSRTLIVVGAGASYEVGLPTGAQLKRTIGQKLAIKFDRNGRLLEHGDVIEALKLYALHKRSGDLQCVLSAAKSIQIAMSQAPSIDDYLDLHGDNLDIQAVGKIAITYAIIEAERSSTLYFEQTKETMPRFEILEDTWYAKFFHALRVPKQNLHKYSRMCP